MDFISNRQEQIKLMLQTLGIRDIPSLFSEIPKELMLPPPSIDDGLSEYEGICLMEGLAAKNTYSHYESYLGAGAYEHHVPAIVQAICTKSEFLTSYTPYQPEASQGMLQIIFEYQSAVCMLTGMDVSNASMYEGASASAEALLMSMRIHKDRKKVVIAGSLHPHYIEVIEQFLNSHQIEIVKIPYLSDGRLNTQKALELIDEQTVAVLLSYPNFFGIIDQVALVFEHAQKQGALSILSANPLMYGLYQSAKDLGADIAVGEMQPIGLPLQFGGPYVGYLACREEFLRQLPGRIVGETVDVNGKRAFVLTLQAREQHIRREKATSNICTNQSLAALASLIAILWYGPKGLHELGLTNYQRAAFLKSELLAIPGIQSIGNAPCFNEFVISFNRPIQEVFDHFRMHGIEPGFDLGRLYPEFQNHLLVAVTEVKNKYQLDRYVDVMRKLMEKK